VSFLDKAITDVIEFSTLDTTCSYIKSNKARTHYKYFQNASSTHNSELTKRGWRRFGRYYSRPICDGCSECKSIRIDVANHSYSKSQRRVIRKNDKTYTYIQPPSLSKDHIRLYNKFHKFKSEQKGWNYHEIDGNHYYSSFVDGFGQHGKEVLYFVDNKLVGVDLLDIVDDGVSSIYFFYDPDYSYLSLGNFSILIQIDLARQNNLPWIYLGYHVDGNQSLEYKTKYKPYQTLQGYPDMEDKENWI
jgi:arginine-tRNA-protein transferase